MSRIPLNEEDFKNELLILPIEEEKEVLGVMKKVPIEYWAEITMSKDKTSAKSGNGFLELTLSIDAGEKGRVSINDIFSYVPKARWKLSAIVELLDLNKKALDTDEFMGRVVKVYLGKREYKVGDPDPITGVQRTVTENTIAGYLRQATPEEVMEMHKGTDKETSQW